MRENNKLIAEFMGFKLQDNPNERWFGQWFTNPTDVWSNRIEILHFDSSWDWLMPVVEKILDLKTKERLTNNIIKRLVKCDLISTYSNVIEFIKQYKP